MKPMGQTILKNETYSTILGKIFPIAYPLMHVPFISFLHQQYINPQHAKHHRGLKLVKFDDASDYKMKHQLYQNTCL